MSQVEKILKSTYASSLIQNENILQYGLIFSMSMQCGHLLEEGHTKKTVQNFTKTVSKCGRYYQKLSQFNASVV